MQTNGIFEFDATCLGAYGLTATWRRHNKDVPKPRRWQPTLLIKAASVVENGAYIPANDISISTAQGLLALRDAIDQALLYDMPEVEEK